MPNGLINPLTAPLAALKQIGEQTNVAIQSLGTGMTQAASQGLDALVAGAPPLPMPGVPARVPGVPAAGLMPANLQQALGQVENLLIPPGLPRPSQMMAAQPTPTPQPTPPAQPTPTQPSGAQVSRRRVMERRGM